MPKVKVPRKSVSLDMTAMVDMAFLLLTFFMLATKFKPQESLVVDMPSSVSEIKLPDTDIMTISIREDGAVFFGVDGQHAKIKMLESVSEKYKVNFTEDEKKRFTLLENFGVPVGELKQIVNLNSDKLSKYNQTGIPTDSLDNQLYSWIYAARVANPKIRIAVKGDKQSDYEVIEKVIATLQEQKINKFNLITSMENRPQ